MSIINDLEVLLDSNNTPIQSIDTSLFPLSVIDYVSSTIFGVLVKFENESFASFFMSNTYVPSNFPGFNVYSKGDGYILFVPQTVENTATGGILESKSGKIDFLIQGGPFNSKSAYITALTQTLDNIIPNAATDVKITPSSTGVDWEYRLAVTSTEVVDEIFNFMKTVK